MNLKSYPAAPQAEKRIVAHRGAWDHKVIENSGASFARARELGAWGVELDIHFTKDGIPIVHHDPNLKRIHNLNLRIRDHDWAQLQKHTDQIVELEKVLKHKQLHFMIEIKTQLSAQEISALTEVLRELTPIKDYHLLALHPDLVFESAAAPSSAWVLVGEYNLTRYTEICIERNFAGVAGHYLLLHRGLIHALHKAEKKAGVGFVPTKNLMNRELARGVDWIFTNTLSHLTDIRP